MIELLQDVVDRIRAKNINCIISNTSTIFNEICAGETHYVFIKEGRSQATNTGVGKTINYTDGILECLCYVFGNSPEVVGAIEKEITEMLLEKTGNLGYNWYSTRLDANVDIQAIEGEQVNLAQDTLKTLVLSNVRGINIRLRYLR